MLKNLRSLISKKPKIREQAAVVPPHKQQKQKTVGEKMWLKIKERHDASLLPPLKTPPKWPIVLCHGMGGDKLFLKYYIGVRDDLESLNLKVAQPYVLRYGSVYRRAELLKEQIVSIKEEFQTEKVNLIAHSMGGLDARQFITNLGGNKIVASLTTISTPHCGSHYADWCLKLGDKIGLDKFVTMLPFETGSHHNLTTYFLRDVFNPQTPNVDGVQYFSFGGAKKFPKWHLLNIPEGIIYTVEGDNDGLVSAKSAQWGEYLGTLPLAHNEQINWSLDFDARILYRKLLNLLGERGL